MYNSLPVAIRPSVCAILALFLYTQKLLSSSLFSKEETISGKNNSSFNGMQKDLPEKMQQNLKIYKSKIYKHLEQQKVQQRINNICDVFFRRHIWF